MKIKSFLLSDLNPAVYNPRKALKEGDKEFEKLKNSIEEFGYVELIIVNEANNNTVISGHQRLAVLQSIGVEEAECVCVALTPEKEKALNIAMNKISGVWDEEKLTQALKELEMAGTDLATTGFDSEELESLMDEMADFEKEVKEDDFDPDEEVETQIAQAGDIWLLGKHRVMCGDSSSSENFDRLMNGNKADMVFTDPPYGVAIGDKNKDLKKLGRNEGGIQRNIANDNIDVDDLYKLLVKCMTNTREACKEDACYFVTSPQGGNLGMMMLLMMKEAGLPVKHILIWEKNNATFSIGRLDYDYQHEPIFYTWTEKHHNYRNGEHRTTIWKYNRPNASKLHPTMKPVALIANALKDGTKKGDICLDSFLGSGSTLVACEETGRICYGMELDPHYVDVIVKRYIDLKGNSEDVWLERDGKKYSYSEVAE